MCILYKISALSLGYPLGMFGVTFGAISCLTRAGPDIGFIKHGAKVRIFLDICKKNKIKTYFSFFFSFKIRQKSPKKKENERK